MDFFLPSRLFFGVISVIFFLFIGFCLFILDNTTASLVWTLNLCWDVTSQNQCTVFFFLLIFRSALKLILMYGAQRKSGLRNSNTVILDCFLSYKQVYFLIENDLLEVLYHLSFCISHDWVANHNQTVDLSNNKHPKWEYAQRTIRYFGNN